MASYNFVEKAFDKRKNIESENNDKMPYFEEINVFCDVNHKSVNVFS